MNTPGLQSGLRSLLPEWMALSLPERREHKGTVKRHFFIKTDLETRNTSLGFFSVELF
jgi:hypothetical protein